MNHEGREAHEAKPITKKFGFLPVLTFVFFVSFVVSNHFVVLAQDRISAAKKEGTLTLYTTIAEKDLPTLLKPFESKYGIKVNIWRAGTSNVLQRAVQEAAAKKYDVDVIHIGSPEMEALAREQILQPMTSPVQNDLQPGSVPAHHQWAATLLSVWVQAYNTKLIRKDQLPRTYKDLLDPKWKGKLILDDPRRAGPGQATLTFFYLQPELGVDFIRALGKQQITILKDYAQEVDAIGQGRYPVLIGTADFVAVARAKQGIPIAIVDPRQLKEGADVSPANGALALFNRAPHPNAAKVYINWLLSKEGQTVFASANGYVSARLDVPTDHAEPWRVPLPGAIKTYTKAAQQAKDNLMPLLIEVFGNP